jgi:hypothetical protein
MSMKSMTIGGFLLLFTASGCAAESALDEYALASVSKASVSAKSPVADETPSGEIKTARRVIREGELRFETMDRNRTRTEILGFVKTHQGYLADDREQRNPNTLEQAMTIRVPSEEFDELLADVSSGVTHFDKREIRAIDVTEEFVDVEARLKTKKETEARYRELLTQAKSVEEILKIEEQIDKLRAEIESTEGRLRLMKDRESYSTLSVSFYESSAKAAGFGNRVFGNFLLGWQTVVEFTIAVVVIWPLIFLASLGLLAVWWFNRKPMAKKVTL